MHNKLMIKNIDKIFGRQITYGWAIMSVQSDEYSYTFQLATNTPNKQIEVKLRREPIKYAPYERVFLYELWAWNIPNGHWEKKYYKKSDLDTMEGMITALGLMLEAILPKL